MSAGSLSPSADSRTMSSWPFLEQVHVGRVIVTFGRFPYYVFLALPRASPCRQGHCHLRQFPVLCLLGPSSSKSMSAGSLSPSAVSRTMSSWPFLEQVHVGRVIVTFGSFP